jgi:hypothetical protein
MKWLGDEMLNPHFTRSGDMRQFRATTIPRGSYFSVVSGNSANAPQVSGSCETSVLK